MRRRSILAAILVIVELGCTRDRLTREKAAELIRPHVASRMTLEIPNGRIQPMILSSYVKALAERGVLRTYEGKGDFSYPVPMAEPTELAKPFVVQYKPLLYSMAVPTVVLANAKFDQVTGVREATENGKSADVEFQWEWELTTVGSRLNGLRLDRPVESPIAIDIGRGQYQARANCSLYDDGWRCELPNWQQIYHLNERN